MLILFWLNGAANATGTPGAVRYSDASKAPVAYTDAVPTPFGYADGAKAAVRYYDNPSLPTGVTAGSTTVTAGSTTIYGSGYTTATVPADTNKQAAAYSDSAKAATAYV